MTKRDEAMAASAAYEAATGKQGFLYANRPGDGTLRVHVAWAPRAFGTWRAATNWFRANTPASAR
jgi:hypothetical protein